MSHAVTSTAPPRQFMLFTADCHIKQRTWTNSTLLRGDSIRAFSKMLYNYSQYGEPLDHLIIGGDLFDSNRPTSADLYQIHRLLANFKNIYYIRGNHDNVEPPYLTALRPIVYHEDCYTRYNELGSFTLEEDDTHAADFKPIPGVHIQGINWDPSDSKFISMLESVIKHWQVFEKEHPQDTLYLVLHCAFKHLLSFDGAYTLDVDMIKNMCGNSHINFLVGHIHTRDTTVYNENGNYIHSPGALYPLSSDRMGQQHFASIINMVDGKIIDVPTDVRTYVRININDLPGGIEAWVKAGKFKPASDNLPTFVTVTVPEDYDKEIILPENPDYVFKIERRLADIHKIAKTAGPTYSINDAIREELQNDANRDMVIEMAEELLGSDDPVGTLNEWLTFWGVRKATC